jgi:sporulation protein YlmC with PRC-barrel domain
MEKAQHNANAPLKKLKDSDLMVADYRQDIRGRRVLDSEGHVIGHASALFIDGAERKIRMLEISGGGFLGIGDQHFLLPVDAITKVDDKDVHVNETGERVLKSPKYDPKLVERYDDEYWGPYYSYYDQVPYWSGTYAYPSYDNWYDRFER